MLRFLPARTLGRLLAVTTPLYVAWEMLQAPVLPARATAMIGLLLR